MSQCKLEHIFQFIVLLSNFAFSIIEKNTIVIIAQKYQQFVRGTKIERTRTEIEIHSFFPATFMTKKCKNSQIFMLEVSDEK